MKLLLKLVLVVLVTRGLAMGQTGISSDVLGMHNMSAGSGATLTTQGSLGCTFCHAPHSGLGGVTPLWNQTLSQANYVPYNSTTYSQKGNKQPTLGVTSSLCLSCHDGTVAVGQSAAYGKIPTTGSMNNMDVFGNNLAGSHPFSLATPLTDASNLVASLVSQGKTADTTGAVKLINGNVECTSCHDPHVQNNDKVAQNFLVRDSSNGQMCLACHDPTRTIQGQTNLLAGWQNSIHQTATNQVSLTANAGQYGTVALNACTSCHMEHNAPSPARLLRPATPAAPGYDTATQVCMTCHAGTAANISPAVPNIMGEMAKTGHPIPSGNNAHDAAEPSPLNNNRHATCVDCHNPHAANQLVSYTTPPALRTPQTGAVGVSASDGVTVLTPAINQYETCLRCHGNSIGKQQMLIFGYAPTRVVFAPDPLNLIPQFSPTSTSSHPVMHDRSSPLPQPSLRASMLNQNGTTSSRVMGTRIFCTDCHNSDDNREFGGNGPNGPHGSANSHILEHNYQFSQAAGPGGLVTNTFPNPDLTINGPYGMCAKCHDLAIVNSAVSYSGHVTHVGNDGFSCSVCHTAHGMGATSTRVTGERMVNFDGNVVAQNNGQPISYNRSSNTCTLVCHQMAHNSDGSVIAVQVTGAASSAKSTVK